MFTVALVLGGDRMKTMQELYSEIIASNELKKAFVEAMKADRLGDPSLVFSTTDL